MIKYVLQICCVLFTASLFAQAPEQINYQAVARNSSGNPITDQMVRLRLTIHDGIATGPVLYQEVRKLKTNNLGLFSVAIGSDGAVSTLGSMSGVNWAAGGAKYIQVELDPTGNGNFHDMGTGRLLSVPYALHAEKAVPTGQAGGDLSGNYPAPVIRNLAVTTDKLADESVTNNKLVGGTITADKLAAGVLPATLPPSGNAGGDLTGSYPNPIIGTNAVTNTKIADLAITGNKIANGAIASEKLAAGVIPASLPPSGNAGGDLGGAYPSPVVSKLLGVGLSTTAPQNGHVLKFDGSQWAPAPDVSGGFILPYSTTAASSSGLVTVTNSGSGQAFKGLNSSSAADAAGIIGSISSPTPGVNATGVKGINQGQNGEGYGVWGHHESGGPGVYGSSATGSGILGFSNSGFAVQGNSTSGVGVFGTSNDGIPGFFDMPNGTGGNDALFASNSGYGNGVTALGTYGNGLLGIANDLGGAGVFGIHNAGGEGVLGRTFSNIAAGVVGRNDGSFAAVRGVNTASNGTGVLAQANVDGAVNGTALVAEIQGAATGNPAVFKANGANVARIDQTGKGFFNGGTQMGGADVAELFAVEGVRHQYEPGDVLVISTSSDRKMEKSSSPYSSLVAGVYATKPGVMLTEENAELDQLQHLVPMGVIGVIPTKVCLEGGKIERGDLLVTSSIPGVAMKADPDKVKHGQILGKALQPFEGNNIGKINVLVSVK